MIYTECVLEDFSLLLDLMGPTAIYNDNKGAVDWANTTSTKNM